MGNNAGALVNEGRTGRDGTLFLFEHWNNLEILTFQECTTVKWRWTQKIDQANTLCDHNDFSKYTRGSSSFPSSC